MQAPRILVIQNKRIGDVLISSVIAANIKKVYPQAHITYFVYDYCAGVLEGNPHIDRIWTVNAKKLKKATELWAVARKVRNQRYDIIFDPYAKFQSRFICLFSKAKVRIGLKRPGKKYRFPYYTTEQEFLDKTDAACGTAIMDRVNMVKDHFHLKEADTRPALYLTTAEKNQMSPIDGPTPVVMFGVLGSALDKSLPTEYIVELIDKVMEELPGTVLFNYAPHQKEDAMGIYEACKHKDRIRMDLYADSIRGFVRLMSQCDLLIANEGGSVHIAKALNKPTFTIFSPYIDKKHWASFEDGIKHHSVHLREKRPELFEQYDLKERRAIMKDPAALYAQFKPELILQDLLPFLERFK